MLFVPMLLTIRDGQGVPSDADGVVRVIILSGAADGQDVPQGARTVDTVDLAPGQYTLLLVLMILRLEKERFT